MFWDRGAGAEAARNADFFFGSVVFFSCEEASLVASSYYIEGQALTYYTLNGRAGCYGTACEGLIN